MDHLSAKAKEDTLPMWVADMDFSCPDPVLEAIHKRVDQKILGYSSCHTQEFYGAISSWFERRFNWTVDSKDIFVAHGVVPAIVSLIRSLTKEGEGVIIQKPVYYPFAQVIKSNGRMVVNNALFNNQGRYEIDFKDLEEKAKRPENTMMILCSPHNPVGRVWTEEELLRLGQICLDNNVTILSDEIHFDLLRKGQTHKVLSTLFPQDDTIIVCTAPSKTFNLAGMNASAIVIRNDEQKRAWKHETGGIMMNPLSIVAVQAAYNECEGWVDQVNEYLDHNMKYIDDYLKENLPLAKHRISEGTYLAWVDLSEYGHTPEKLEDLMIEKGNVLFDMGPLFGSEGNGFLRINAACPLSLLKDGLERISAALA